MVKTFFYLFKEARPRQWIKNLIIFTAVFFSGELLNVPILWTTILAFLSFCAASSAIYYINDMVDVEKDRLHPFKKNRPIASGKIPFNLARGVVVILLALAMFIAYSISVPFLLTVIFFVALHLAYSYYLKNIILLDILTIAAGFILRVVAGEVATGFHISVWLLLTVISAALFMAIGKRRSELTLMTSWEGGVPAKTRATLTRYSEKMLDVYISMFANSTWITYAFYSFLARPTVLRKTIGDFLDETNLLAAADRKWMMLTIPFAIYGIMRYLQLIYEKNQGESPEKVLLSDKPLIATAAITGGLLFGIIYIIGK